MYLHNQLDFVPKKNEWKVFSFISITGSFYTDVMSLLIKTHAR